MKYLTLSGEYADFVPGRLMLVGDMPAGTPFNFPGSTGFLFVKDYSGSIRVNGRTCHWAGHINTNCLCIIPDYEGPSPVDASFFP